jgi:hypothetical protein
MSGSTNELPLTRPDQYHQVDCDQPAVDVRAVQSLALLFPKTRSNPPITIAPTPTQIGTFTVSLSAIDNTSGPILAS